MNLKAFFVSYVQLRCFGLVIHNVVHACTKKLCNGGGRYICEKNVIVESNLWFVLNISFMLSKHYAVNIY